ncbi:hypothetical protein BME96_19015 (plasmid) [Virgibacillus halodenitrificans]|uniref:Uncharacterized protein n=1 Tax=Virgibacillus halodenitrificans TaxID=1482 RepID=A0AAC9J7C0_VIRHA|nr:hypothetical protein [Virgibacillus halodenitrificans]APC50375.1 hypothetical protein BME96_19015 [Virgibacillus halodenitrificans]
MITKEKHEVANLLQNLSNAVSDREGDNEIHQDNDNYINGVIKAIPKIEKALNELKLYFE